MDFLLGRSSGVAGPNGSTLRRDGARGVETRHSSSSFFRGRDSRRIGVPLLGFGSVLMARLVAYISRMKTVSIGVCVKAVYFEDFGNEATAGASFDLYDDVERICDVGLDGAVRQFNPALKDATCKS